MTATGAQSHANLLDLPDVVAYLIVDYCGFRPSLKLRRLCKTTKYWVDSHPSPLKLQKTIVLDTKEKLILFNSVVKTLPLKDFELGPFHGSQYPWTELQTFANQFAHGIRNLCLKVLNCFETKLEVAFIEKFTSLSHLTIGLLRRLPEELNDESQASSLPDAFNRISFSSIQCKGLINLTHLAFERVENTLYFMDLINSCPNLQYIALPSQLILSINLQAPTLLYSTYEKNLMEYASAASTKSLGEINFRNGNPLSFTGKNKKAMEEKFIIALYNKNVRLSNIPIKTLFRVFKAHDSQLFEMFKQQVVSVFGVWPSHKDVPSLPNVKEFTYDTSSELGATEYSATSTFDNMFWPKLKSISATIYNPRNHYQYLYYMRVHLLLYASEMRSNIEHMSLEIRTSALPGNIIDPNTERRNQLLLIPADIIFSKFPNLKTLTLIQTEIFTQNPRHYSSLFRALGLQTVIHTLHISSQSAISPDGFNGPTNFGVPPEKPSFQYMQTLRKFTLHVFYEDEIQLSQHAPRRRMLENRALRAFRDTNLEWLEFTGVAYSNVTAEGLYCILKGRIANTIETFIFDVFSLSGCKRTFPKKFNVTVDNIDTICWRNQQKKLLSTAVC